MKTRDAIIAELKSNRINGATAKEIAFRLGRHVTTIRRILNRLFVADIVYFDSLKPRVWRLSRRWLLDD